MFDIDLLSIPAKSTFEFVKDAVILVQVAEFGSQVLVDVDSLYRFVFHGDIPDFEGKIVARQDIPPVLGEFDVGNGGNDLGKEGFLGRVFFFLEFWG